MPLVELIDGPSQWTDIQESAYILWQASKTNDRNDLALALHHDHYIPSVSTVDLHTGINQSRKAVLVSTDNTITIGFIGSGPNELAMNLWTNAKGPRWWDIPYPVYEGGNRVHSFFRDMWSGMRSEAFDALSEAVERIIETGMSPERIVITGFSMGGGVSTLAFTEILEHIRSAYGSASSSPNAWAADDNLGSLMQHLTFAAVGAADRGFYTILNQLYERYQIRAWDFVNHLDFTMHIHDFAFRAWRGHRYILPDAVVQHFNSEFGPQNHFILGYLKAAEWMRDNGTDQVKSFYSY